MQTNLAGLGVILKTFIVEIFTRMVCTSVDIIFHLTKTEFDEAQGWHTEPFVTLRCVTLNM